MDKDKTVEVVRGIVLEKFPALQGIYLFGSYGTSYMRQDSDIDLAFLQDGKADPVRVWNIAQEIARVIGRDVDLVDLNSASTVFRFQIISEGSRVVTIDNAACDAFELMALSRYYHFNEARKELIEDFR